MEQATDFEVATGRRYIIERPRLTRLLDNTKARVIMLVAPAGYGKTTLARQWLEAGDRTYAWYRGSPASADVAALAVGLVHSAATICPDVGRSMRERLRATPEPEREANLLAEMLAEDLRKWPTDAWLAIDDYQFVMGSPVAEDFVDSVSQSSGITILLTSRDRPRWATARRLLYGDIYELGQTALAMNQQEAEEALFQAGDQAASGLVVLAHGWPALIGLAALRGDVGLPDGDVSSTLYEYFAEELYKAAPPEVQSGLCRLAVAPRVDATLARSLLGDDAAHVLESAVNLGFLSPGTHELHPLLRTYLLQKLRDEDESLLSTYVADVGKFMIRRQRWDDAFSLAQRFDDDFVLDLLLDESFDRLLKEGRLVSLARWIERARARGLNSPTVALIEAELALRRGSYDESESLALEAHRAFPKQHALLSRTFEALGRAAHLADREAEALAYHAKAERFATSTGDMRNALWGQVISGYQLECDVAALVKKLENLGPANPTDVLRLAHCQWIRFYREGHLSEGTTALEAVRHVVARVEDPMIRTSFCNAYARALSLQGRYGEAEPVVASLLRDAVSHRLQFVFPHAYAVRALVDLGLRRFASATTYARKAAQAASGIDIHNAAEARTILCKVRLAQGAYEEAARASQDGLEGRPTPGMYAEYLATNALALVMAGRIDEGRGLLQQADATSRIIDARAIVLCARAVADLRDGAQSKDASCRAVLELVTSNGHVDAFVASYRACPDLLAKCVELRGAFGDQLELIVSRARDHEIARRLHFEVRPSSSKSDDSPLSRREREVYELVGEGLQNREIARILFISEATVKVHVRHILEKLGLRSRTEAAVHAARQQPL